MLEEIESKNIFFFFSNVLGVVRKCVQNGADEKRK
jgi:hypothetical protein